MMYIPKKRNSNFVVKKMEQKSMICNTVEYNKNYDKNAICNLIEDFSYELGVILTDAKEIINFNDIVDALSNTTVDSDDNPIMRIAIDGITHKLKELINTPNLFLREIKDSNFDDKTNKSKSAPNSPLTAFITNKDQSAFTDPNKFDGEVNTVSNILENEDCDYIPSKIGRFGIARSRLRLSLSRTHQLESCVLDALKNLLVKYNEDSENKLYISNQLNPIKMYADMIDLNEVIQRKIDNNWHRSLRAIKKITKDGQEVTEYTEQSILQIERSECSIYDRVYIFSRILNISIILYTVDKEEWIVRKDTFDPPLPKLPSQIYLYYNPHTKDSRQLKWIQSSKGKDEPPVEEECRIGCFPKFGILPSISWGYNPKDNEDLAEAADIALNSNGGTFEDFIHDTINTTNEVIASTNGVEKMVISDTEEKSNLSMDIDVLSTPKDALSNTNSPSNKRKYDEINNQGWIKKVVKVRSDIVKFIEIKQCYKLFVDDCNNSYCQFLHLCKDEVCNHKKIIRVNHDKDGIKIFKIIGCDDASCIKPYCSLCDFGRFCRNNECKRKKIHTMNSYQFEKPTSCTYNKCMGMMNCKKCKKYKSDYEDSKKIFEDKYYRVNTAYN